MPRPPFARRTRTRYDAAVLGVYVGPPRTQGPPRLTAHRARVLAAIGRKEVHVGKGQHAHGFRWNDSGAMTTVTRTANEFISCGWAHIVGAHVELTESGWSMLDARDEK